jgi:hypothetical protein
MQLDAPVGRFVAVQRHTGYMQCWFRFVHFVRITRRMTAMKMWREELSRYGSQNQNQIMYSPIYV